MPIITVGGVVDESLIGDRVGLDLKAEVLHTVNESLIGDRVGRTIAADVQAVTVDVLIKVAPVYIGHMHVEALIDLPDDPTRPGVQVWRFAEEIAQQRDPLPHPSVV